MKGDTTTLSNRVRRTTMFCKCRRLWNQ